MEIIGIALFIYVVVYFVKWLFIDDIDIGKSKMKRIEFIDFLNWFLDKESDLEADSVEEVVDIYLKYKTNLKP